MLGWVVVLSCGKFFSLVLYYLNLLIFELFRKYDKNGYYVGMIILPHVRAYLTLSNTPYFYISIYVKSNLKTFLYNFFIILKDISKYPSDDGQDIALKNGIFATCFAFIDRVLAHIRFHMVFKYLKV